MSKRFTEEDLRAAFTAKATEAPKAEDVLRAVRKAERPRPSRLRWLIPAGAAAAAVAVAVPLALNATGSSKKSADNNLNVPAPAAGGAQSTASAFGSSKTDAQSTQAQPASKAPAPAEESVSAICRPQDVTATLTVNSATQATLVVTAHGPACSMRRIPSLHWASALARPNDTGAGAATASLPAGSPGRLSSGASATAPVRWDGACASAGAGPVLVNWGAGDVDVHVTAASPAKCAPADNAANLRIGAFTGLS